MDDIKEDRGYQGYNGWVPTYRKRVSRRQNSGPIYFDKLGNYGPKAVTWTKSEMVMVPQKNKWVPLADAPVSSTWPLWRANAFLQTDAFDQATRKLYGELANANAMLPLMFAERQSTVDLVTSKVEELIRIKRNFRKRVKHLWKKHDNKAVHNAWLEYRYGWMPTILDVDTLINKELGLPSLRVQGYARRHNQWELLHGTAVVTTNVDHIVSMRCFAIPKNPMMKAATQYGIANPLSVLWEAVPYSFVVDWFLDIGGYLESLGALNGIEIVSPSYTLTDRWSQEVNVPSNISFNHGYSHWRGSSGERFLGLPKYPNPLVPSNGLNLTRFFDSVALLRSYFKK